MVKAHATHQCGPGLNPGPGVISLSSLLLVLDDPKVKSSVFYVHAFFSTCKSKPKFVRS